MSDNETRASRFDESSRHLRRRRRSDTNLIDLLADAMHWCDHTGRDFHIALAQACRHYIHELNDQQQDERRMNP